MLPAQEPAQERDAFRLPFAVLGPRRVRRRWIEPIAGVPTPFNVGPQCRRCHGHRRHGGGFLSKIAGLSGEIGCSIGSRRDCTGIGRVWKKGRNHAAALVNYGDPKLTVYEGVGHNSWTATYDNPEVYQWLLSHRISERKPPEKK